MKSCKIRVTYRNSGSAAAGHGYQPKSPVTWQNEVERAGARAHFKSAALWNRLSDFCTPVLALGAIVTVRSNCRRRVRSQQWVIDALGYDASLR